MVRTINPLKAAFKVILALEEEGISYGRLDEVLKDVKKPYRLYLYQA